MSRSIARFLPVALLLTVTAIFLQARTRGERIFRVPKTAIHHTRENDGAGCRHT